MPHKFKAPVQFFQANPLPPRCIITGRTDNIQYHDLQLPFLRGLFALPAILIPPFPAPKTGTGDPGPATDATTTPTTPPALHLRNTGPWRDLFGLLFWMLLISWFGFLFGTWRIILYLNLGLLFCSFIYRVFFKAWRQRKVDAQAFHFALPIAVTTPAEGRQLFLRKLLRVAISVPYYVALVLFVTRINSPYHDWYTGLFWSFWFIFIFTNRWINNAYPMVQLGPKKVWLEIRLPDKNKALYDAYCLEFMRWKQSENFPTDIDYDINDWPDEGDGTWDRGRKD